MNTAILIMAGLVLTALAVASFFLLLYLKSQKKYEALCQKSLNRDLLLQTAAEAVRMVAMRCDRDQWFIVNCPPDMWGTRENGKRMSRKEWIEPTDLACVEAGCEEILTGKRDSGVFTYRAGITEKNRCFELTLRRNPDPATGANLVFGIIRDITDEWKLDQERKTASTLLQALFDELPGFIFVKDAITLEYTHCNRKFAQSLKKHHSEIIGKTDFDLFNRDEAENFTEIAHLLLREGGVNECNIEMGNSDCRQQVHFLFQVVEPAKQTKLLIGLGLDITQEEARKKELHQVNLLLKDILDNLPCHLFVKDCKDFTYLLGSRLMEDSHQLPSGGIKGKTDNDIYPEPLAKKMHSDDLRAISSGKPQEITERIIVGGKGKVMYTQKKLLHRETGDLLLGMSLDMSELNENRNALEQANCELKNNIIQQQMINHGLEILMLSENENDALRSVLSTLIEYLRAGRGYIFRYDFENKLIIPVQEYILKDNTQGRSDRKNFSIPDNSPILKKLTAHEVLEIPDTTLPDAQNNLGAWSRLIREHDVRSFYVAGISEKGNLWGGIAVTGEAHRHTLNEQSIRLLQATAHMVEILLERRSSREKLNQALVQAQNANQAKSIFLSTMSHELRTPLNAVIGFAELLKHGSLEAPEAQNYLANMSLAAKSLLNLINDILDLSKLDAGKMPFVRHPSRLSKLLKEVRSIFQPAAMSKHLTLELQILDELPILEIDDMHLRQILMNLVGNAIKFTPTGKITIRAAFHPLSGDAEHGLLQLTVSDTGIGIAQERQDSVFDMFSQINQPRDSHAYKGTGLGLAICKQLVDHLGGNIRLESMPGKGSTFLLEFPSIKISNLDSDKASKTTRLPDEFPEIDNLKLMLIDDVPMNLTVLGAMVHRLGIQYQSANSALEAIKKLEDYPANVVLTDIWMPGIDGCKLAQMLHGDKRFDRLKILAVTADSEIELGHDLSYFDGVLIKPITFEKLKAELEKYTISG